MNSPQQVLLKYWGYSKFRPMQEDIILSVLNGKDTLGLMPTGGGKSITFQVPAMVMDGICIVVTPLIALMRDQVENLKKREIKALAIYSGMTYQEIDIALDNCVFGDFKFLYCSPERLGTEIFQHRVQKMNVNLIVVDEAHCISQWGYDFRPSYLQITKLRDLLPAVPVLALTATATPRVAEDIMRNLAFREKNLLKMSFERKNLVYLVREAEDKQAYLLRIMNHVKGSGIVYVRNRQKTRQISEYLNKQGISSDYYHAGLNDELRRLREENWKNGRTRVIVATNAFGMGIDKPDVRFVIHIDLPDSPEAYYQEAGRAGRDEKKSYAVLLFHASDIQHIQQRIDVNFPEIPFIYSVYNAVGNYFQIPIGGGKGQSFAFNLFDFCNRYKWNSVAVYSSLKILEREGYLELTDDLNIPSMVHFLADRDDLYKFQVANAMFDDFIKLLLRSYSGFFSGYVGIDESALAQRAKLSRDQVYQFIMKLQQQKILHYIPKRTDPVIILCEERLEEKNLNLSHESYRLRMDNYKLRLESMLKYASASAKCRSQFLLEYFGEENSYRCGQCDICERRNELDLSTYEFDQILFKIKLSLQEAPRDLREVVDLNAPLFEEDKSIRVVQWLLDNKKIVYNEENKLEWCGDNKSAAD